MVAIFQDYHQICYLKVTAHKILANHDTGITFGRQVPNFSGNGRHLGFSIGHPGICNHCIFGDLPNLTPVLQIAIFLCTCNLQKSICGHFGKNGHHLGFSMGQSARLDQCILGKLWAKSDMCIITCKVFTMTAMFG